MDGEDDPAEGETVMEDIPTEDSGEEIKPEDELITITDDPTGDEEAMEEEEMVKEKKEIVKVDTVVNSRSCPGFRFPSAYVNKAAIYADEERVYGIRLLFVNGPSYFGSLSKGIPVLESFGPTE